ncbi:type I-F CRISPR-associated helicase Cas3f [Parasphaerochaeta coccoides]|uniref:CRISPR-associated helicase Cas3 family n=1 Tax=Parasphaerochaeta coccoides (strain ATCC BAA-1237 / DSM 17374 / SPN1) TaxID=760011 RepID=F4GL30_PARC1|nr:type I-F CRISPR-associated helicase Cas3f [Parasphaerochaeta coccoides]AEC02370.1 CRISPR-associated helicase Cas3 family [Parasphaerochaeta coccoides DSM 17374]
MIVMFVSQCSKKAMLRTARVLDTFADRIGDRVWRTVITEEGLLAVKKLLKKTASKNTAVACHYLHGTFGSELLWVVGNRNLFDRTGRIPVSITHQDIVNVKWENSWDQLPCIQYLVALAALFHDWGKASLYFQKKLQESRPSADPLRHEWISALLFTTLVTSAGTSDRDWLEYCVTGIFDEKTIINGILEMSRRSQPFISLPPLAQTIVWLILSHHKLPVYSEAYLKNDKLKRNMQGILALIQKDWGYEKRGEAVAHCFLFPKGLPCQSLLWVKNIKEWALRALDGLPAFDLAWPKSSFRLVLSYARLSLMLGDYSYSFQDDPPTQIDKKQLYANTDGQGHMKQTLDDHLNGVMQKALRSAHLLPSFAEEGNTVQAVNSLKEKSRISPIYYWQDKASTKVADWVAQRPQSADTDHFGFFAINMASTGCGKTVGNAKIMQSLSKEEKGLRYVLALGLRTLTLQTGAEYRKRIGLDDTELAVIIGSKAFEELFNQKQKDEKNRGESESSRGLFDGEVNYDSEILQSELAVLLNDRKSSQLLYSPVLACTIDYIIAATEVKKGGRWMLPFIRLMSSDLVIDEIDDFTGDSMIAVGRLIHLAGMLGRKVVLSSATIPPDMAEGYFRAYQRGWAAYAEFHNLTKDIGCAWIDEFACRVTTNTMILPDSACEAFRKEHHDFGMKRIRYLRENEASHGVRRRGLIVSCQSLFSLTGENEKRKGYYELIMQSLRTLHDNFSITDGNTGKRVSFGCIRVAHVNDCIDLTRTLIASEYPDEYDVRVMAYHSRQVLLLRNSQERHLDAILANPGEQREKSLADPIIRHHLDTSPRKNIIFIVVATPVEEVGRDHDFDWAVIEPSSYRSIIQLAGRVRRHRLPFGDMPNIYIMQYNLAGLLGTGNEPVFCRPGYESEDAMLKTHDMSQLIDGKRIGKSINASPRIVRNDTKPLQYETSLVDLEHYTISRKLASYERIGPDSMEGWLQGFWFMTAFPQVFCPFRSRRPSILCYDSFDENDRLVFGIYDKGFHSQEKPLNIHREEPFANSPEYIRKRFWLARDYAEQLTQQAERTGESEKVLSLRYGEIEVPTGNNFSYCYSDQLGLEYFF